MAWLTQQKPDPALVAAENAAKSQRVLAIRERVSQQTEQLLRQYGSRRATGAGFTRPPMYGF